MAGLEWSAMQGANRRPSSKRLALREGVRGRGEAHDLAKGGRSVSVAARYGFDVETFSQF